MAEYYSTYPEYDKDRLYLLVLLLLLLQLKVIKEGYTEEVVPLVISLETNKVKLLIVFCNNNNNNNDKILDFKPLIKSFF